MPLDQTNDPGVFYCDFKEGPDLKMQTPLKICGERAQQHLVTLPDPSASAVPCLPPPPETRKKRRPSKTRMPLTAQPAASRKPLGLIGENDETQGLPVPAWKEWSGMRGKAVQWSGPVNVTSSSSNGCVGGALMSDIASSPVPARTNLPFETPSTQLARFTLATSSSIAATPIGKMRGGMPMALTACFEEMEDEIGGSLAEILTCDDETAAIEEACAAVETCLMDFVDDAEECEEDEEEEMLEHPFLGLAPIAEAAESSLPPSSPCKASPRVRTTPNRRPLGDKTNNHKDDHCSKRHWSRLEDDDVPIPKLRRTQSDALPLLPLPSTTQDLPVDCEGIPSHASPKDAIRRVTPETVVALLDGHHANSYDRLIIIDARYPYEYLGGHIPTAVNICGPEAAEKFLFSPELLATRERVVVIFHCEFSSERAPRMALHIRNLDRAVNAAAYPRLTYPDIYILEGGYRAYFLAFRERCEPPNQYLPMRTQRFRDDLRFHQRMKASCPVSTTASAAMGFQGNKYNRSKIRACSAGGVGLRKTASTISAPAAVEAYMATARLAPGEAMPTEFPSSDGPDIFQGASYIQEAANCFQ